jgi:hypothetical protein
LLSASDQSMQYDPTCIGGERFKERFVWGPHSALPQAAIPHASLTLPDTPRIGMGGRKKGRRPLSTLVLGLVFGGAII